MIAIIDFEYTDASHIYRKRNTKNGGRNTTNGPENETQNISTSAAPRNSSAPSVWSDSTYRDLDYDTIPDQVQPGCYNAVNNETGEQFNRYVNVTGTGEAGHITLMDQTEDGYQKLRGRNEVQL